MKKTFWFRAIVGIGFNFCGCAGDVVCIGWQLELPWWCGAGDVFNGCFKSKLLAERMELSQHMGRGGWAYCLPRPCRRALAGLIPSQPNRLKS